MNNISITSDRSFSSIQERLPDLEELIDSTFRRGFAKDILNRLRPHPNMLLLIALDESAIPVGFKLGYEVTHKVFFSWLGGVRPTSRRAGIGSELMKRQHEWCKRQGFREVWTRTKSNWKDMIALNIRHNFKVIGTFTDHKSETAILFRRDLLHDL